jgi:hypothetical protein
VLLQVQGLLLLTMFMLAEYVPKFDIVKTSAGHSIVHLITLKLK